MPTEGDCELPHSDHDEEQARPVEGGSRKLVYIKESKVSCHMAEAIAK